MNRIHKPVILLLLGFNALTQLGGGLFMVIAPESAAVSAFDMVATPDVIRAIGVIAGSVLGFLLITLATAILTVRDRPEATVLLAAQGAMLVVLGATMLATGTMGGAFDLLKGVLLTGAGIWAARRSLDAGLVSGRSVAT